MIILTRRAARRSPVAGDGFDSVTRLGATVYERRHDVAAVRIRRRTTGGGER
jgi:hypothetical protein